MSNFIEGLTTLKDYAEQIVTFVFDVPFRIIEMVITFFNRLPQPFATIFPALIVIAIVFLIFKLLR